MTQPTAAKAIEHWRQPASVLQLLRATAEGDQRLVRALGHLIYGTLALESHDELIDGIAVSLPVPQAVWRALHVEPKEIDALGLLLPGWEHYVAPNPDEPALVVGRCREFRLDPSFAMRVARTAIDGVDGPWADVCTGTLYKGGKRPFERVKEPKAGRGRPRRLARGTINWEAGKREAYRLLALAEAISSPHHIARALSAVRGLLAIRSNPTFRMSSTRPGFASYCPTNYRGDCGSRWYEQCGGFQGLPGVVKAALMEGTGLLNYDLKGAHLSASVVVAGLLNSHLHRRNSRPGTIPTWLTMIDTMDATPAQIKSGIYGVRDLIKTKDAFDKISELAQLPRGVVKTCVYSILYGGSHSDAAWRDRGKLKAGAVMDTLLNHHDGALMIARASHARLEPLLALVTRFAGQLLSAVTNALTQYGWLDDACSDLKRAMLLLDHGKQRRVLNACLTAVPSDDSPQRILSHILTGLEQDAISHLLVALETEGIVVFHLEHDGLIVDREIPAAAVKYMQKHSLLQAYARLDVKPLADPAQIDELDALVARIKERTNGMSLDSIDLVACVDQQLNAPEEPAMPEPESEPAPAVEPEPDWLDLGCDPPWREEEEPETDPLPQDVPARLRPLVIGYNGELCLTLAGVADTNPPPPEWRGGCKTSVREVRGNRRVDGKIYVDWDTWLAWTRSGGKPFPVEPVPPTRPNWCVAVPVGERWQEGDGARFFRESGEDWILRINESIATARRILDEKHADEHCNSSILARDRRMAESWVLRGRAWWLCRLNRARAEEGYPPIEPETERFWHSPYDEPKSVNA